ncbi:MAG TPA: ABC transporter permease, partial [Candidatus Polarisedimenticolaceae bacterium]|nr:ABC transporter permease [Candidatus Polarisedimenticolaceae bacterium]
MNRLSPIWALARAESRLAFRLVRYWVFLVLATLFGAAQWGQFYLIHHLFSAGSASAASANPRYFIGNFGGFLMLIFVVGLIFLAFDVRARDRRERIDEVVDTTPVSNLEFVLGRALGILLAVWLPMSLITLALAGVVWAVGAPIEPVSLAAFLFLMMIPGFLFSIGLVFLVTIVVRTRLLAAIASAILLTLLFVAGIWWIPFYLTPLTDMTGGYSVSFPSDLIPSLSTLGGWAQRSGYALMGLAMLWLTAAMHPRRDDSRRSRLAAGGALMLAAGLALCAWQVLDWRSTFRQRESWRAAHQERAGEPLPSIRAITGEVRIDPGRSLAMQLELRVTPQGDEPLESALFSLNPGLTVERVAADGVEAGFTQEDGLLDVALASPLVPGTERSLSLSIHGVPDGDFAYLDAPLDILTLNPAEAQIFILGFEPLIFDRRYVALMPGSRWLPAAGTEIGRGPAATRPRDFFDVDLTLTLPDGWRVAGPGRDIGDGGSHRFRPPAPVPQVALIGARFESWSTEIDGVKLELLLHPSHA